jgi:hypothetical protein
MVKFRDWLNAQPHVTAWPRWSREVKHLGSSMCGARSARGFVFPLHIVLFSVDLRWRHKQAACAASEGQRKTTRCAADDMVNGKQHDVQLMIWSTENNTMCS